MPLSALLSLFTGPQKLIQKRYDKLLDCNSYLPRAAGDASDLAKKEYEALNAQLVEELQVFNRAARKILWNCLCSFVALLGDLTLSAQQVYSTVAPVSTGLAKPAGPARNHGRVKRPRAWCACVPCVTCVCARACAWGAGRDLTEAGNIVFPFLSLFSPGMFPSSGLV